VRLPCRKTAKGLASLLPVSLYERAGVFSLERHRFNEIRTKPTFAGREQIWTNLFHDAVGRTSRILLLEFGVWKGYSIKYFASLNTNTESRFVGFDSFEGLPEN
jgi:hypothetical protein